MCGIAGFALRNGSARKVDLTSLQYMTRALAHRGPDDEGYEWNGAVGLGSRRLSIIDLSPAGRMPLFNENKTVGVVHNGEIYNFKALRHELAQKGHQFTSQTDTEVIAHLYEEYGDECFAKLDGMFAFALWDDALKRLILARDRFGEKPLYYFTDHGDIAFASELRSFSYCPFFSHDLDWDALNQFLTLGYILSPRSPYQKTAKLLPGHYLIFDSSTGDSKLKPYWQFSKYEQPSNPKKEREYVEEFSHIFGESVRSRLVSDVPVGAFLSGGIDSSLVVTAMAGLDGASLKSFSIGFPGSSEHDETPTADLVARSLGIKHHSIHIELNDVVNVVERLPNLCDEPIGDTAFISIYLITKVARASGSVVMLSGDGGDELFLGYPIHRWAKLLDLLYGNGSPPQGLARLTDLASKLCNKSRVTKASLALKQKTIGKAAYYLASYGGWTEDELQRLTGQPDIQLHNERFLLAFKDPPVGVTSTREKIRSVLLDLYLPDNNLARMDRASMANSVETRAPFLHPDLYDFAARLPSRLQIRGSTQKYLLRKVLGNVLPATVAKKRKQGFNAIPMRSWMGKELGPLIEDFLSPAFLRQQGIFNSDVVERLMNEHRMGGRFNHWVKLWLLLVLQMWLQHNGRSRAPRQTKPVTFAPASST